MADVSSLLNDICNVDIKRKLKPTITNDRSAPIIRAMGEEIKRFESILNEDSDHNIKKSVPVIPPPPPAPLSLESIKILTKSENALAAGIRKAPISKGQESKLSQSTDRSALMDQIKSRNFKLRKTSASKESGCGFTPTTAKIVEHDSAIHKKSGSDFLEGWSGKVKQNGINAPSDICDKAQELPSFIKSSGLFNNLTVTRKEEMVNGILTGQECKRSMINTESIAECSDESLMDVTALAVPFKANCSEIPAFGQVKIKTDSFKNKSSVKNCASEPESQSNVYGNRASPSINNVASAKAKIFKFLNSKMNKDYDEPNKPGKEEQSRFCMNGVMNSNGSTLPRSPIGFKPSKKGFDTMQSKLNIDEKTPAGSCKFDTSSPRVKRNNWSKVKSLESLLSSDLKYTKEFSNINVDNSQHSSEIESVGTLKNRFNSIDDDSPIKALSSDKSRDQVELKTGKYLEKESNTNNSTVHQWELIESHKFGTNKPTSSEREIYVQMSHPKFSNQRKNDHDAVEKVPNLVVNELMISKKNTDTLFTAEPIVVQHLIRKSPSTFPANIARNLSPDSGLSSPKRVPSPNIAHRAAALPFNTWKIRKDSLMNNVISRDSEAGIERRIVSEALENIYQKRMNVHKDQATTGDSDCTSTTGSEDSLDITHINISHPFEMLKNIQFQIDLANKNEDILKIEKRIHL